SSVPTPEVGAAIMMPIHCDSSGDIFVRPPLSKIGPDGRRIAIFDLSAARSDGLADLALKTFAVDPSGSVYELAKTKDERVVIIKFDRDGHYTGSVILDEHFEPLQLGVFESGTFLVSGVTLTKAGSKPEFNPYTALFDRSGRFIKNVDTSEPANAPPASQKTSQGKQSKADKILAAPELGLTESDGANVYLLVQGKAPTLFVISPAGVVDRKLSLAPPPYPNLQVSAFRVGVGQILLEYVQPNALPNGNAAYYLVLYDSLHGDELSEYTRGPDVSGTLGCTDWKGNFSFLSANDREPILLKARMQ
ncbi:MAG: hypothetical protein ACRD4P_11035, partial [Bryobacteraceae bacterium]